MPQISLRAIGTIAINILILSCALLQGKGADMEQSAGTLAQQTQLLKLIEAQEKTLASITSLQYSATSAYQAEPQFMQEAGDAGTTTCKYSFTEKGKDWLYDVDITGKSGLYVSEKWAYNGDITQSLQKKDGQLTITKDTLRTSSMLANKTYIFDPIIFLPQEIVTQANFPLTLQNFASSVNWKSLLSRATGFELRSSEGRQTLSFQIPGGVDVHTKRPFIYKVVCAGDMDWYPIEWQTIDLKGHLLTEYKVIKMGSINIGMGLNFLYPISAEKRRYVDDGRLAGVAKISIDTVKIGSNIPDDFFTIDPSQATSIRDLDSSTVINVPQ